MGWGGARAATAGAGDLDDAGDLDVVTGGSSLIRNDLLRNHLR